MPLVQDGAICDWVVVVKNPPCQEWASEVDAGLRAAGRLDPGPTPGLRRVPRELGKQLQALCPHLQDARAEIYPLKTGQMVLAHRILTCYNREI